MTDLQSTLSKIAATADWAKGDGILPAVIQDADSKQVLMLGYVNEAALALTAETGKMTFFSRSKQRLWTKGETSGNWLTVQDAAIDCDNDTILIAATPAGPTCHTGTKTCFGDQFMADTAASSPMAFLQELSTLIAARHQELPENSYTTSLFAEGKARIAQKVGEEGVELALARMKDDTDEMANEAADLLFHMMVLLEDAGLSLNDAVAILQARHK